MRYFRLLGIMIIMAALTACEKVIIYDDLAPEPFLVVNGFQHVGEPVCLSVEKSSFYINSEKDLRVKDLHADLYVNGIFKESLQVRDSIVTETYYIWTEEDEEDEEEVMVYAFNYCEGAYLLCEGDEIRVEVSSSEFDKVAVAEIEMPLAPKVISFDTVRSEVIFEGAKTLYFSLIIDDPVGKDCYNFYPKDGFDSFVSTDPVFYDFMDVMSVDDLFGGSEYYGYGAINLFDDSYFDGHQYSVTMTHHIYTSSGEYEKPFTLEVSRVDYGYYQYMKSLNSYQSVDDELLGYFTEPTQVYSNVKNGLGVVGAQSNPVIMVIDLTSNF